MKICVAQTKPFKGDIEKNIDIHKKLIKRAVSCRADIIVFPELSLTGYEPGLAKDLAKNQNDPIFDPFQEISNMNAITCAIGMPVKNGSDILISMIIFQPYKLREIYSKQYLHQDELPYFAKGHTQLYLDLQNNTIAPAICYESLLPEHSAKAVANGAEIYIASAAKSINGVEKACKHYAEIAATYSIPVLMANCVGFCDNFESAGKSSVWNNKGILAGQLDEHNEGIIIFDTATEELIKIDFELYKQDV